MSLSREEIQHAINLIGEDSRYKYTNMFHGDFDNPPGYTFNSEETFGGFEGSGETMWAVMSVKNLTTGEVDYFRINGFYSSYDSPEWRSGFELVEPRKVEVTQWFTV